MFAGGTSLREGEVRGDSTIGLEVAFFEGRAAAAGLSGLCLTGGRLSRLAFGVSAS